MSTSLTADVLRNKVAKAASVLSSVPTFKTAENSPDPEAYIWERLAQLGIYEDDDSHELLCSDNCPEGVARAVFCEGEPPVIPVPRFLMIWRILKEGAPSSGNAAAQCLTDQSLVEAIKAVVPEEPVGQMPDQKLVNLFAASKAERLDVVEELERRARGQKFVVYSDEKERAVNQERTVTMLRHARRGLAAPPRVVVDDKRCRLYRASEIPCEEFVECPLHSDVLLFEGNCDGCGFSWEGVSYAAMQFCRLVAKEGQMPQTSPAIRSLIGAAKDGVDSLKALYPLIGDVYDEMKEEGRLPRLRRRTASASSVKDPLYPGKTRRI